MTFCINIFYWQQTTKKSQANYLCLQSVVRSGSGSEKLSLGILKTNHYRRLKSEHSWLEKKTGFFSGTWIATQTILWPINWIINIFGNLFIFQARLFQTMDCSLTLLSLHGEIWSWFRFLSVTNFYNHRLPLYKPPDLVLAYYPHLPPHRCAVHQALFILHKPKAHEVKCIS